MGRQHEETFPPLSLLLVTSKLTSLSFYTFARRHPCTDVWLNTHVELQSRPLQGTGTLGRSRVVAGKTFITQAMKDQAQQLVQEAERKKEEERQLREEKLKEAAKKKEELLKSRAEEKKK